ncbi:MAG: CrcB family protein [Acidimicrobiaceae bacterium]|nr:CrcB family protein [Acidimicrobiaceae bacterium]MYD08329.1 CrcB family protein [Acidimicrobiaceae bacterium]MYI58650.1 CrcB family protein [Acidimicrobiaceae bacterium]
MIVLAFGAAALIGTLARWQLGARLRSPQGTFVANIAGTFAFGLLHASGTDEMIIVGVGGLGAFTTFSALAGELVQTWPRSRMRAVAYGSSTLVAGVGAALLAISLA